MDIDPSDWGVISIRATGPGPGRGHKGVPGEGLHTIARLTLIEALQEPEYEVIAEDVRQRMITILKSYVASGLIEHDEIF